MNHKVKYECQIIYCWQKTLISSTEEPLQKIKEIIQLKNRNIHEAFRRYLGEYLHDFGIGKGFLSIQKATSIKLKIGKMDFIKIEAFLTSKPTNNEVKGKLYIVRKHS